MRKQLSAPFQKYDDVCGERDGVESAKRRRGDAFYRRGEATKTSARPVATRRTDGGCGGSLRWSSSKMARHRLPPPALISPHKPHLQTSSYFWNGACSLHTALLLAALLLSLETMSSTSLGAEHTAFTDSADAGADFQVQGEYVGSVGSELPISIQVIALGNHQFQGVLHSGGLPGNG